MGTRLAQKCPPWWRQNEKQSHKEPDGRVSAESGLSSFLECYSGWASELDQPKFTVQTLSLACLHVGRKAILVMLRMTGLSVSCY